jgi:DNA-binding transcriptional LysR family regulator
MARAHLDDISTFVAVVDAGSFVAGGRSVGLTRSAAGKALVRLEERMSTRLLNRTTRAISLTDDGRVFYEHCTQVLAALEDAEAAVGARSSKPRGILRITVPDSFGRLYVLPLLHTYLMQWPELEAEVSFTDRAVDIVEEGFDLAVRIQASSAKNYLDAGLISRVVARHRGVLCASPAYLQRRGEPSSVDELSSHECVMFKTRTQSHEWRLRRPGESWVKVVGRSRLRVDSGEALLDATIAGLGVAYLPGFLADKAISAGELKELLPTYQTEFAQILVVYPSKRHLPAKVRYLIDYMVDQWKTDQ